MLEDYIGNNCEKGILLTVCIQKAFDPVDLDFMLAFLKCFGCKGTFKGWMKDTCIMNIGGGQLAGLGWKEEPDNKIHCLLTSVSILEIVFIQIRKSEAIKGFSVEWSDIKLTALADNLISLFGVFNL